MKWKNDIDLEANFISGQQRQEKYACRNYVRAFFPRLSASLLNMAWISCSRIWVQIEFWVFLKFILEFSPISPFMQNNLWS